MQVKKNISTLAATLMGHGYKLVTSGTDNHLLLWDLRPAGVTGSKMERVCELAHITLNKNSVQVWPCVPRYGSETARTLVLSIALNILPSCQQGRRVCTCLDTAISGESLVPYKERHWLSNLPHHQRGAAQDDAPGRLCAALQGDTSAITPGGVRIGAPAMTSRGLKEADFERIGGFLHRALNIATAVQATSGKLFKDFDKALVGNADVAALREEVEAFASAFPMPGFEVADLK